MTIGHSNIYSCNIDGSNVKKVLDGGANEWEFELGGAYYAIIAKCNALIVSSSFFL